MKKKNNKKFLFNKNKSSIFAIEIKKRKTYSNFKQQ